jgi:hypothetical protein
VVSNGFITKLNVEGDEIVYSSYIGFYENVQAHGIAVDKNLNAYVTGETSENITPTVTITPPAEPPPPFCDTTTNGFQTTFGGGGTDAFVVKIDATASQLLYCSYLGGSGEDVGYGVAVDTNANAYLTGLTYSTDLPLTHTATYTSPLTPLQATYAGAGDAFLSKVNTNGSGVTSLLYSTYIGGSGLDQGNGVAVDSNSNAYIAGATTSINTSLGFTPPAGAYQTNCKLDAVSVCEGDAFVAKFTPTLSGSPSLIYFTYLGGSLADSGAAIAVDTAFNAYITGATVSTDFPTLDPSQKKFGGGNADAFVAEINPAGTHLVYSSFLGGSSTDTGGGIAVDLSGDAFLTGQTCSVDFPLSNPLQPSPAGNCDAFISKVIPSTGVALTPAGLIFPVTPLSTTSEPQTITLTNGSSSAVPITSIAVTGTDAADFHERDNCDTSVAGLSQCTITVTFEPTGPTAVGTLTAEITAIDGTGTQVADLTGTGGAAAIVSVAPTGWNFGSQDVGVASSPETFQITNTGTLPLTITAAAASGDFNVQTNHCATAVQPGTKCNVSVIFTPSTVGSTTGALTLTDNAPGSPQVVLLTGTGAFQPLLSLSATNVIFPVQIVGSTSAPQVVTVTNAGSAPLTFTHIAASAGFGETSTCGSPVASGAICTISVTFTPSASGSAVGSLSLTDNAPGSPQAINLSGTGALGPIVSLSQTNLTFASQSVGTTSPAQAVTLTNTGSARLEIAVIASSGDFGQTNTCPATLAIGANCTINVTFTPTAVGNRYGNVSIGDNAANSPQTITLAGVGLGAPAVTLSTNAVGFGSQLVKTTSAAQTVTVTNSGSATLVFTSITTSAPFAQTNTCASVAPQGTCTITVTFSPTTAGSALGSITLTDNAGNSPQSISLTGTGTTAPTVSLMPLSITFTTAQAIGSTSPAQTVTLSNTGSATLLVSSIGASGDFGTTNTCGASVAAGANCSIAVTFTPTAVGNRYGTLTVTDNNNGTLGSTQTVALEGTGQGGPLVTLSTSTLTFASEPLQTSSASQAITLTNSGTASLSITSIVPSGDFSASSNCGQSLGTGAACTINVTFTPTAVGTRTGSLTITDSAPSSPQVVTLTGGGSDFGITVTPTAVTVVAGNSTSVAISVSPLSGFSSGVSLTCTGLPTLSTCTASPGSVTPSGTTAATSTLNITTTRRSVVPPMGLRLPPGPGWIAHPGVWLLWVLLLLGLGGWAVRKSRPQWSWAALAIAALWIASFAACGAGGTGYVNPTGTPAGTYTITVTGTSGNLTHSASFSLTVQ